MFGGFGAFDARSYADEARERWSDSDAYKGSMRRAPRYTKDDWLRIHAEGDEPVQALASLMKAGAAATSREARDAADRARLASRPVLHPCSRQFHVNLASMYEVDPRLGDYYESRAPGLRDYVVAAIRANLARDA